VIKRFKIDIDKLLEQKYSEHERDIAQKEHKLEEYIGLSSEKEIKSLERLLRFSKTLRLVGLEVYPFEELEDAEPPLMRGTTGDWDFDNPGWSLDTGTYVSEPSSLKLGYETAVVLCKYPGTYPVNQGRIVTYSRFVDSWGTLALVHVVIYFRNQREAGGADDKNTYFAQINVDSNVMQIGYVQNGSWHTFSEQSFINKPSKGVWFKWRVTWFETPSGLEIHTELYQDGSWVKMADPVTHSDNKWSGSSVNRCGIGSWLDSGHYIWFDDTEIWKSAYE